MKQKTDSCRVPRANRSRRNNHSVVYYAPSRAVTRDSLLERVLEPERSSNPNVPRRRVGHRPSVTAVAYALLPNFRTSYVREERLLLLGELERVRQRLGVPPRARRTATCRARRGARAPPARRALCESSRASRRLGTSARRWPAPRRASLPETPLTHLKRRRAPGRRTFARARVSRGPSRAAARGAARHRARSAPGTRARRARCGGTSRRATPSSSRPRRRRRKTSRRHP